MNRLARILITGPRTWTDCASLGDALLNTWHDATQEGYDSILVTHGTAEGADTLSDDWARAAGVPRDPHPADWAGPCAPNCPPGHRRPRGQGDYCPFAGHRRNDLMVRLRPVLCVACISPCDRSWCRQKAPHGTHGTADAIRRAEAAEVPILRVFPAERAARHAQTSGAGG